MKLDVVGVGAALVDVLAEVPEAYIAQQGLTKGAMRLIEAEEAVTLYKSMPPAQETSGGSVANSIAVLASLGGAAGFIGKVAKDQLGDVFAHDMKAQGVNFVSGTSPTSLPTGRCLIAVTPDGERTMSTSLGCNVDFGAADLSETLISSAKVVYLEGYAFDRPAQKEAFYAAAKIAKQSGTDVALTLSDSFCVERHRDDFLAFIKSDVDVLFANEKEITSLYQCEFDEAVAQAAAHVKVAVVTRSEKGAIIRRGGEIAQVAAASAKVVDVTGAGDAYSAGFLFGYTRGKSLGEAGRIGALCAAEVISHFGARPQANLKELVAAA